MDQALNCPECGAANRQLSQEPYRTCSCGKMVLTDNHGIFKPVIGFDVSPYLDEAKCLAAARKCGSEIFIDVGANRGQYTLQLQKQFKRIIAVEPHPDNAATLWALIRYIPHVEIMEAAASNRTGDGWIQIHNSCWRHSVCAEESGEEKIPIKLFQLSDIVSAPTDLVKVDVEGHELMVLEGAKAAFPLIRNWIIECHSPEIIETIGKYLPTYTRVWIDKGHLWAYQ